MDRLKRPRDTNQLAKFAVDAATDERKENQATGPVNEFARAAKLSSEESSRIAAQAARARWHKGDDDNHG